MRAAGVEDESVEWSGVDVASPRPRWVHLACAVTVLFAALHVYWALGGVWGLPPAARLHESATRAANWVVTGILVVGAGWVLGLNRPAARRVPSWVLLTPLWVGGVVCVSHAAFGFVTKGLYLAGHEGAVRFPVIPGVDPATAAADERHAALLDLVVFEPFFLAQGLALALAGWQFIRTPRGRRRWTRSAVAGVLLIDGFGVALSVVGLQAAIG